MQCIALLNTVLKLCAGVPSRASLAALPFAQRAAAWGTALGTQPKHSSSSSSNTSSSATSESSSGETAAQQQSTTTTSTSTSSSSSSSTVTVATAGGLLAAGAPCCRRTEACVTEVRLCYVISFTTLVI
jgi:hypothetical protein